MYSVQLIIILFSLLSFILSSSLSYAGVLSNEMGQGPMASWLGNTASVSSTNTDLNAAFVFNTSGTALGIRFTSPVTQSSGSLTIYLYLAAKTGTPTNTQMDIYPGPSGADDPQRPGSTGVLCTVTSVDLSGVSAPAWATYSATGCTLTAGNTYWAVFSNNTATPASNYPSFRNRGLNGLIGYRLSGWSTTNGFTTDPSLVGSTTTEFPAVFKFNDGTLMGQPYVVSTTHASNANDRGVRFRFSQKMKFAGLYAANIKTSATNMKVYNGSTLVDNITIDLSLLNNFASQAFFFSTPLTFEANTDYDIVFTGGAAATSFPMITAGTSPPADVTACTYTNQSYVDGTTPGSYTITSNATGSIILIPDSFVANSATGTSISVQSGGSVSVQSGGSLTVK